MANTHNIIGYWKYKGMAQQLNLLLHPYTVKFVY